METNEKNVALQRRLFELSDGFYFDENAKSRFLNIMSIRMGKNHKTYKYFEKLLTDTDLQWQMLQSKPFDKIKEDFRFLCHVTLKSYISNQEPVEGNHDSLLFDYFLEIEKCINEKRGLYSFDQVRGKYEQLPKLEYSIIKRIHLCDEAPQTLPEDIKPFSAQDYLQIFTAWQMYPEVLFYNEQIEQMLDLLKEKQIFTK